MSTESRASTVGYWIAVFIGLPLGTTLAFNAITINVFGAAPSDLTGLICGLGLVLVLVVRSTKSMNDCPYCKELDKNPAAAKYCMLCQCILDRLEGQERQVVN